LGRWEVGVVLGDNEANPEAIAWAFWLSNNFSLSMEDDLAVPLDMLPFRLALLLLLLLLPDFQNLNMLELFSFSRVALLSLVDVEEMVGLKLALL
jgi:hypothetical protein